MTTSTKLSGAALSPRPPAKGSFPLDHLAECKPFAIAYERCLEESNKQSSKCRREARAYLQCRMERGLMAKEEWNKLGLSQDVIGGRRTNEEGDSGGETGPDKRAEDDSLGEDTKKADGNVRSREQRCDR